MATLRMVSGVVVKQSGLVLEILFGREDYGLRLLLLCEGEIMVKYDPQFLASCGI